MQEESQNQVIISPLTDPTLQKLGINKNKEWRQKLRHIRLQDELEFPKMKNSTILDVFDKNTQIDHLPVWMMRQAGRYLPEFKETRKFGTFFDLCEHPILACEVTLQPLARMPSIDASIIFSDILVIPQAMGMEVKMEEKKGPVFPEPLRELEDMKRLNMNPDVEKSLGHVFDAIYLTRMCIDGNQTLYGFCGAPWTLFTYMTEGSGSKMFSEAKKWIYSRRKESLEILNAITDISIEYLSGQIRAGAQIVQIFDSWAGELGGQDYIDFAFNHSKRIAQELKKSHPDIPITLFAKGQMGNLEVHFQEPSIDCIGIDYSANLQEVKRLSSQYGKTIQGNLDPGVLLGSKDFISEKVKIMIDTLGTERYIVNLGHGLWPSHDPEHVKHFVEEVQRYSNKQIQSQQKE